MSPTVAPRSAMHGMSWRGAAAPAERIGDPWSGQRAKPATAPCPGQCCGARLSGIVPMRICWPQGRAPQRSAVRCGASIRPPSELRPAAPLRAAVSARRVCLWAACRVGAGSDPGRADRGPWAWQNGRDEPRAHLCAHLRRRSGAVPSLRHSGVACAVPLRLRLAQHAGGVNPDRPAGARGASAFRRAVCHRGDGPLSATRHGGVRCGYPLAQGARRAMGDPRAGACPHAADDPRARGDPRASTPRAAGGRVVRPGRAKPGGAARMRVSPAGPWPCRPRAADDPRAGASPRERCPNADVPRPRSGAGGRWRGGAWRPRVLQPGDHLARAGRAGRASAAICPRRPPRRAAQACALSRRAPGRVLRAAPRCVAPRGARRPRAHPRGGAARGLRRSRFRRAGSRRLRPRSRSGFRFRARGSHPRSRA